MQRTAERPADIATHEPPAEGAAGRWLAVYAGPLTVMFAAVMSIIYATRATIGDFYHMLEPAQNLLSSGVGGVYPEGVDGTSLSGWLALTVVPFVVARTVFTDDLSWTLAGLIAVPLLVGGVRYAARALHPQMSAARAWGLAAVSLVLPTTVSCWTEYYHPQDVAAVGIMLFGLGLAAKHRWVAAGALFGFAILTRHWVLLVALAVAPLAGRQFWRYAAVGAAVVAAGLAPLALTGNPGLIEAITAKNAAITEQTLMGNVVNNVVAEGNVAVQRAVRALPLIAAAALAGLVWLRRWRDPSYLIPVAVTAIGLRFIFETAPYTYYWVPVPILLLLVSRKNVALVAGAALSLLVWPVRPIGAAEPFGDAAVAGLFFSLTLLSVLFAWTLRDPVDSGETADGVRSGGQDAAAQGSAATPRQAWVGAATAVTVLLSAAVVTLGPSADRAIADKQAQQTQAEAFQSVDFAEVDADVTPDAVRSITGTSPTGQPFTWTAGKPAVVAVWTHWCAPCTTDLPAFKNWLAEQPPTIDGFAVFTDARPDAGNWPQFLWLQSAGWEEPSVLDDETGTLRTALGAANYPTYLVVSADGTVLDRLNRFDPNRVNELVGR